MNQKEYLKNLFLQALERCSPARAVAEAISLEEGYCKIKGHAFSLSEKDIYVLSVGKASVEMFNSSKQILGGNIAGSLVITNDENGAKSCTADKVVIGSHPVPGDSSLEAGRSAVEFFKKLPEDALLLFLISGGASSLMCLPAEEISIINLSRIFDQLLSSGAGIHDINAVRKHCSQIKGGQLLRHLNPGTTLVNLAISDVPHDDLSIIGSGPTTPDSTTFHDVCNILIKHDIWEKIPASVQDYMGKGIAGEVAETLELDENPLKEHHSYIISSARKLAEEAAGLAIKDGFKAFIADEAYNDDVEKIASSIAGKVLADVENKGGGPHLFILYGESTVKVSGDGKGGRNQEMALRGALKISGNENITWLSAGTDGIDGPTDTAGAIVDGKTAMEARERGLDPDEFLQQNNSYHFHQKMNTFLKTGPTGNNLMDIVLVSIK